MKLDHVVYFTQKDLQSITAEQQKLGNHAVPGGRHEQWGTANVLYYTANGYIEWLALQDREKAQQTDQPLVQQLLHDEPYGDQFAAVCFSVQHIEDWKEQLDNKGFKTTAVFPASRKTADGHILRWKMLFIDEPISNELPYPFFIEWEQTEEQRFAQLEQQGVRSSAPSKRIAECIFRVEDPLQHLGEWAVLLSQKVNDRGEILVGGVVLRFEESAEQVERLAEVRLAARD